MPTTTIHLPDRTYEILVGPSRAYLTSYRPDGTDRDGRLIGVRQAKALIAKLQAQAKESTQ